VEAETLWQEKRKKKQEERNKRGKNFILNNGKFKKFKM
jgi:hypothetical protein